MKNIIRTLIQYLGILIPMGVFIVFFIFWMGEMLGDLLIGYFGDSLGLFIRPVVVALVVIALLYGLRIPLLVKTNQLIWFKRFTAKQIDVIYRNYTYGMGSFAFLTTLVVLNTYLALIGSITWFNSSNYLFAYLLILLVVVPASCIKLTIDKNNLKVSN